jgi:hypothetical protein
MTITVKDVFPPPAHGWTCFHCDETFCIVALAMDHFGVDQGAEPACKIKVGDERNLVSRIRDLEAQLARYRAEDSDTDRAMYRMQAEHLVALRRAEEAGYERGMRDALAQLEAKP